MISIKKTLYYSNASVYRITKCLAFNTNYVIVVFEIETSLNCCRFVVKLAHLIGGISCRGVFFLWLHKVHARMMVHLS